MVKVIRKKAHSAGFNRTFLENQALNSRIAHIYAIRDHKNFSAGVLPGFF